MKTLPLGVEPIVSPRYTFDENKSLIGLSHSEVAEKLKEIGVPEKQCKMRAQQIWHWIYLRGAKTFDEMSNISKDMRERLKHHFGVGRPEIIEALISKDGTRKWLMKFPDGQEVETVFIPEEDRGTLCVSSQVGCTLTCTFCHNNKYPIDELMMACKNYAGIKNSRKITFEYILLKDVNDSDEDALNLVKLIKDYKIPAKVNLIPFNPWPGSNYERPSKTRVAKFSDLIFSHGISAPVRTTRGEDILAACGQLKSESEKARKVLKSS